MSVDAATVRRIAHLARIAVAEEEVEHLQGELNAILAFVEQLSEVNVEGVEPMTSVTPMEMKKRPDVVTDGGIAGRHRQERAGDARTISFWSRRWWNEDGAMHMWSLACRTRSGEFGGPAAWPATRSARADARCTDVPRL